MSKRRKKDNKDDLSMLQKYLLVMNDVTFAYINYENSKAILKMHADVIVLMFIILKNIVFCLGEFTESIRNIIIPQQFMSWWYGISNHQ